MKKEGRVGFIPHSALLFMPDTLTCLAARSAAYCLLIAESLPSSFLQLMVSAPPTNPIHSLGVIHILLLVDSGGSGKDLCKDPVHGNCKRPCQLQSSPWDWLRPHVVAKITVQFLPPSNLASPSPSQEAALEQSSRTHLHTDHRLTQSVSWGAQPMTGSSFPNFPMV